MMHSHRFMKSAALALSGLLLTSCASFDQQQGVARANRDVGEFAQGELLLARSETERQQQQRVSAQLLGEPLGQTQAVQLMLANSPSFQALMAQNWWEAANAAQSGRIANPVFTFESVTKGSESELSRFFSFGLLDLLTLPQRSAMAERRIEQAQLRLASDIVERVTQVRQAWVRAVAASQSFSYAQQVYDSAQVSAELARRMEAVGNFNRLTRARHQAFYADAATQLVLARQSQLARREELVRLLGLDSEQARLLRLPERLPALPRQAMSEQEVGQQLGGQRLDIQLARATLDAAARAQGLVGITSRIDIELKAIEGSSSGAGGELTRSRGYEIGLRLPIFDWGSMQRDAMSAQTLAAANALEATVRAAGSGVRESYSAYRAAYEISRHYKDEVIPLRQVMAEENILRYNGMIIGVFELLADARDQVSAVISAISADQQFWLADAALRANLIGRPMAAGMAALAATPSAAPAGH